MKYFVVKWTYWDITIVIILSIFIVYIKGAWEILIKKEFKIVILNKKPGDFLLKGNELGRMVSDGC